MKTQKTIFIETKIWNDFRKQSIDQGKSVSKRVEFFMINALNTPCEGVVKDYKEEIKNG